MTNEEIALKVAKIVADVCHGKRRPNTAQQRYEIIYQAAYLGAREALNGEHK